MSAPTSPYATSAQVGYLIPALLNGNSDFTNDTTTPKKALVEQYISWISNQINMKFQEAGYIVPFQELEDESWPTHQTEYLALTTSLGAAAWAGGHTLKPAPALSPSRGTSTGNIYQDMYNMELKRIYDGTVSSVKLRAYYYASTPAEKSIMQPYGPNLDYLAGRMNPEDFVMFEDYTNLKYNVRNYIVSVYPQFEFNWDVFYNITANNTSGYG